MKALFAACTTVLLTACSSTPPSPAAGDRPANADARAQPTASTATGGVDEAARRLLEKRSIYFAFDSATVAASEQALLEAHGEYLARQPKLAITLVGNTDERGSREYNLALGQKRAEAARRILLLRGARSEQAEAISYGAEKPKAKCHDESCWQENRRVDLVYPSGSQ